MGIIRSSVIEVKGKKTQSLIIFIITLLILLFEIIGFLIQKASQAAEEDTYRQIGLKVAISPKTDIPDNTDTLTTDNMIRNLIEKEHVTGYNSSLESYCTPVNFYNVKLYSGIDPATQNDNAYPLEEIEVCRDQICLMGGLDIEYNERFYKNQNELIKGVCPDNDHQGAIISEQLADVNGLEIGDALSLKCDDTQNTTNIKIIGIYHTNLKFDVLNSNYAGEAIYQASPYNIVYTNYDIVNSLKNNVCPPIYLTVWVDSPQYIKTVMDEISRDEMWNDFDVYDITGIYYNEFANQLTAAGNMSEYLIVLSLLFGGIILIIAMTFFANSYIYEIGLYIVLGIKKSRIFIIQFLQSFLIVFTAMLVSLGLSPFITAILNNAIKINYISLNKASSISCFNTGELDIKQNFHVSLTSEVIIGMAVVLIIISIVSAVIPLLATIRTKPREILAGNKKG